MDEKTNENELDYLNLVNDNVTQNNIENAFSDLISEYFTEEKNTQNLNDLQVGKVLDWDSVTDGQLFENIEPTNCNETDGNADTNKKNILYNNLEEINIGLQKEEKLNNISENIINPLSTDGKDFKLTQANLPAKISIWTKVRNFFRVDSKINYSIQQPNNEDKGLWNKLQNLFSFGKNK